MPRSKKYTDKQFISAVKSSLSIRETLKKLGLQPTGGNYCLLKKRVASFKLDTKHWLGQGHLKGKKIGWNRKQPLAEILILNSSYTSSNHLRERLIQEGIFEKKCGECGLTKWRGKPLSFDLEHKNGDRFDNRKENLIILCPNCHSQTPTYRGRNKGKCL